MTTPWSVTISAEQYRQLHDHLFPGDGDEHAAVLHCGLARGHRGNRLLVRSVVLARDNVDYIPGDRGYRKLLPEFVAENIDVCAEESLAYIAVHNHGGSDSVGFSAVDLASHARGYPALLDINDGTPVGALVLAEHAVAGEVWLDATQRQPITHMWVVGRPQAWLTPRPSPSRAADPTYDRQSRFFGDRGQERLSASRVAVVGLGGVGSLVSEYLARLGVGELVLIDPDRLEVSNIPRVVGATRRDARASSWVQANLGWLPWVTPRSQYKVNIAARVARTASDKIQISAVPESAMQPEAAHLLTQCDHIFLAADSALVRRLVNSITHQYLIPNTQIGSKVSVVDGKVVDIFSVSRMSNPGGGCLNCAGLIPAWRLTDEATSPEQRARQRYVNDEDVHAPSVITLNAVSASRAVDDWLMAVGELADHKTVSDDHWVRYHPMTDEALEDEAGLNECSHCGPNRFALGDGQPLLCNPQ